MDSCFLFLEKVNLDFLYFFIRLLTDSFTTFFAVFLETGFLLTLGTAELLVRI